MSYAFSLLPVKDAVGSFMGRQVIPEPYQQAKLEGKGRLIRDFPDHATLREKGVNTGFIVQIKADGSYSLSL